VESVASFHTTRWTIVMKTAQSQAQGGESALVELGLRHGYPLYAFSRRRGYSLEDAQGLTQGFFLHLPGLRGVNPLKGKFQSFLLNDVANRLEPNIHAPRDALIISGGKLGL
jgi:RNA polymerase sigma-70 factor (ECF subfamily)